VHLDEGDPARGDAAQERLAVREGCGRPEESNMTATPRTSLRARPMVPLLDEAIVSILSSAMAA